MPGVGVTQAERVAEAEEMIRDLIDIYTDDDADNAEITIDWNLGDGIDEEVAEVARAREEAEEKAAAAKATRNLAAHMKDTGLTGRDIAAILKISEQRVSQLLNANVDIAFPDKNVIVVGGQSVRFSSSYSAVAREMSATVRLQKRVGVRVTKKRRTTK